MQIKNQASISFAQREKTGYRIRKRVKISFGSTKPPMHLINIKRLYPAAG